MLDYLPVSTYKRWIGVIFVLAFFLLILVYKEDNLIGNHPAILMATDESLLDTLTNNGSKFLVFSPKCKIPDLDPFNPQARKFHHPDKYAPCRKLELLTYVTKTDNTATLHVDTEIVPSYAKNGVSCCYSNVTRQTNNKDNPDDGVKYSKCANFKDNVTVSSEIIHVKCKDSKSKKDIYENVHAAILKTRIKNKLRNNNEETNVTKPISVLFVGIDSISRLNLIRSLPMTHDYLEYNNWIALKGYNKMDDNTFPNLMAILTGYNQSHAYDVCNPRKVGKLDNCSLLWFDYRNLGYVTGYAEDEAWINTFNYKKKGFSKAPADFYFRPYILATEKLKKSKRGGMNYCTGPETAGERIMNLAKDFAITYKDTPNFGFFWMNTFSHNDINSPSGMDKKVRMFLEDLTNSGVLDSSIVIFLSDHGIRFGEIRYTYTGWLEERLPFIYLSFPESFKTNFPREFSNFKNNVNRLTNPYDLHMTLQHILTLSNLNHTIRPSDACPKCRSLFEEVDFDRSCEDAGIEQHWCTCSAYHTIDSSHTSVLIAIEHVLGRIQDIIYEKKAESKCAKYALKRVISSSVSRADFKNDTYLLLVFETDPKAVFESTVLITNDEYSLQGGISRLDQYSAHSYCASDSFLKVYCYCR